MKISFHGIFRNLRYKRTRTLLTTLSIAIGVFSVVVILSISQIGKSAFNDELDSLGADGVLLSAKQSSLTRLANADLAVVKENSSVRSATPIMLTFTGSVLRTANTDIALWGVDSEVDRVICMDTLFGRMLNENDIQNCENVCLIDKELAETAYKRQNIVGKQIRLLVGSSYETFKIVGVVSTGGNVLKSLTGDYIPTFVYIPYTTMQLYEKDLTLDRVAVKFKEECDIEAETKAIIFELENKNSQPDAYQYSNMAQQKDTLNRLLDIVTVILSAVALVSVIVAGIGIMTVMTVAVSERTKEIGIKKSVGAGNFQILMEFLLESLFIALLGSLAGGIFAETVVIFGAKAFAISFAFNAKTIIGCVLGAVVLAMIFGISPAITASRMRPVDALKEDG